VGDGAEVVIPVDLDLRRLRYFVAVADHLHFGRAAEALYITQPTLSRQIRQLEHRLGVTLFARTTRGVRLTDAGQQLAREAPRLLAASRAAIQNTRQAGKDNGSLVVGFKLGVEIDSTVAAFARAHPATEIVLKRIRWWNQAEALLEGAVDVAFLMPPFATEGLAVRQLYEEVVHVALPSDHPLASERGVTLAELAEEPVLTYAQASPQWQATWTLDPRPDGSHPILGPAVRDMEEVLAYVKSGRGVSFLPAGIIEGFRRPDVAYVPVRDIPTSQIVIAWNDNRSSVLVDDFVETAVATLGQELATAPASVGK
jgi:DNA-binding transcriptional LysR family regulator